MPRPLRLLASGVLVCAIAGAAAACGGEDKPSAADPSGVPSVSPTASPGVAVSNDPMAPLSPVPGLPANFPSAEIPLLAGPVTQPVVGSTEVGKRSWVLELKLEQESGACFEAAEAALLGHGFVKQATTNENGTREGQYTAPGWAVIISTSPSETGGCRLGYEVGEIAKSPAQ